PVEPPASRGSNPYLVVIVTVVIVGLLTALASLGVIGVILANRPSGAPVRVVTIPPPAPPSAKPPTTSETRGTPVENPGKTPVPGAPTGVPPRGLPGTHVYLADMEEMISGPSAFQFGKNGRIPKEPPEEIRVKGQHQRKGLCLFPPPTTSAVVRYQ